VGVVADDLDRPVTLASCALGHAWPVPLDADFLSEHCPTCGLVDVQAAREYLGRVDDVLDSVSAADLVYDRVLCATCGAELGMLHSWNSGKAICRECEAKLPEPEESE